MTDEAGPTPVVGGRRRAAVAFIFVTILLDMLALGMVIPVLPELIKSFRSDNTILAAQTLGIFNTVWATMQFLASPIAGALSDRFGRRPVVLLSNFGLGCDYVLMALAPSLGWLFIGRLISGITSASIPTGYAYIADVTPIDRRAKAFGLLGAAFGVGFVLGPALGGVLGHIGPRLPFWVAASLSLANAMYGTFVLPESLPADRRAPFSWQRANPIGALRLLRSHARLAWFGGMHFLYYLAHASLPTVFVLYADYRYGWDSQAVGYTLAAVGVSFAIVQGGLVGPIVGSLGERRALMLALVSGAAGFTIYGLAATGPWFLAGIPVMAFWGLYGPSAQSLMTRRVNPSEQGRLQGALASVVGIANVISPFMFSRIFAASLGASRGWQLPGAAFLLSALLLVIAGGIGWEATKDQPAIDVQHETLTA
jgi:DHA1 family tetracycline resistance protein-like MFS transporter